MFADGTTLRKKALAWVVMVVIFGSLGITIFGIFTGNWSIQIVGGVLVAIPVIWGYRRSTRLAKSDPELAQKLAAIQERGREKQRVLMRQLPMQLFTMLTVLFTVTSVRELSKHHWNISTYPRAAQAFFFIVGLCAVFVSISAVRKLIAAQQK